MNNRYIDNLLKHVNDWINFDFWLQRTWRRNENFNRIRAKEAYIDRTDPRTHCDYTGAGRDIINNMLEFDICEANGTKHDEYDAVRGGQNMAQDETERNVRGQ